MLLERAFASDLMLIHAIVVLERVNLIGLSMYTTQTEEEFTAIIRISGAQLDYSGAQLDYSGAQLH